MQISTQAPRGQITAVLGPTNTGKTHLAVERMLGHASGVMGFPLRLLAREVYDRVVAIKGPERVALMTGEEKIIPPFADYFLCTTESMPRQAGLGNQRGQRDFAFVGIDEIQMAADPERGHVFTDKILHARGTQETMLLGAGTMAPLVRALVPKAEIVTRERFSQLRYVSPKKISRMPRRTALVAFSIEDVYAHAELLRRQKGGCAIVMGALSPRTRNAQVELYQNGDVDYLVATDAIGMGLNMDIDTVVFASKRKFDGRKVRELTHAEMAQIAGRAGRHMSDGAFTSLLRMEERSARFTEADIAAIEGHQFPAVKKIFWRAPGPDFSSIDALIESLEAPPGKEMFLRAKFATDVAMLKAVASDKALAAKATDPSRVKLLWDVCQVPDFRKLSGNVHARLLAQVYTHILDNDGILPDHWLHAQIDRLDNVSGDIDTLAQRIAAIRTWTFISNRPNWLENALYWSEGTRAIEDRLSDQLHERLTQRFVDKRTSILLRQMKEKGDLMVDIEAGTPGQDEIVVEGHKIGTLKGFNFAVEAGAPREEEKMLRAAADKALRQELDRRAVALSAAKDGEFSLDLSRGFSSPQIKWRGATIATVEGGDDALSLSAKLLGGAMLDGEPAQLVLSRLNAYLQNQIAEVLQPLIMLRDLLKAASKPGAEIAMGGQARAVAFQLVENLGVLPRGQVDKEVRALDQVARRGLRQFKIRFGSTHVFIPLLLKPAATDLRLILWAMANKADVPVVARPTPGLVWIAMDKAIDKSFYRTAGFHPVGANAVRIDMLERLADAVRPLGQDRGRFTVSPDLMGYVGASGDDFTAVMRSIGYKSQSLEAAQWAIEKEAAEKAAAEKAAAQAAAKAETIKAKAAQSSEPAAPAEAPPPGTPAAPTEPASSDEPTPQNASEAAAGTHPAEAESAPETGETKAPDTAVAQVPQLKTSEGDTPQTETPPETGTLQEDITANAEAPEVAMVTVFQWETRQKRAHGGSNRHKNAKGKQKPGQARSKHKGQERKGGGKPHHQRRKEPAINPDSPFAALAGLKDQLAQKK
jgi:ATP-dependent RNA helicase SUPV3L1/SUV3